MKKWKNDRIDRRIIILAIQSYYCGTYFTLFWSRENCYIGSGDEFLISEYLSYASLLSFTPHPPLINTTSHYTTPHYTAVQHCITLHHTTTLRYTFVYNNSVQHNTTFFQNYTTFFYTERHDITYFNSIQYNSTRCIIMWYE